MNIQDTLSKLANLANDTEVLESMTGGDYEEETTIRVSPEHLPDKLRDISLEYDQNSEGLAEFDVTVEFNYTGGQAQTGRTPDTFDPGLDDEFEVVRITSIDTGEELTSDAAIEAVHKNSEYLIDAIYESNNMAQRKQTISEKWEQFKQVEEVNEGQDKKITIRHSGPDAWRAFEQGSSISVSPPFKTSEQVEEWMKKNITADFDLGKQVEEGETWDAVKNSAKEFWDGTPEELEKEEGNKQAYARHRNQKKGVSSRAIRPSELASSKRNESVNEAEINLSINDLNSDDAETLSQILHLAGVAEQPVDMGADIGNTKKQVQPEEVDESILDDLLTMGATKSSFNRKEKLSKLRKDMPVPLQKRKHHTEETFSEKALRAIEKMIAMNYSVPEMARATHSDTREFAQKLSNSGIQVESVNDEKGGMNKAAMDHMAKVNKGTENKYPNRGKGKPIDKDKFFGKKVTEAPVDGDYTLSIDGKEHETSDDLAALLTIAKEELAGDEWDIYDNNSGELMYDSDDHIAPGTPEYADHDDSIEDDDYDDDNYDDPKPISDEEAKRLGQEFSYMAADVAVGGADPIMMFIDDNLNGQDDLWMHIEPYAKEALGLDTNEDISDWAYELNQEYANEDIQDLKRLSGLNEGPMDRMLNPLKTKAAFSDPAMKREFQSMDDKINRAFNKLGGYDELVDLRKQADADGDQEAVSKVDRLLNTYLGENEGKTASTLKVGDKTEFYWGKGQWLPAEVVKINDDGGIDVDTGRNVYELNPNHEVRSKVSEGKTASTLKVGDKIEFYWGKGQWLPAEVVKINDDGRIDVDTGRNVYELNPNHEVRSKVSEGKTGSDYKLYHKTYSEALQYALKYTFDKRGYEVDAMDYDSKVASGPRKPSAGDTNSFSLELLDSRTSEPANKLLHIQIYNMDDNMYELNMYIDTKGRKYSDWER